MPKFVNPNSYVDMARGHVGEVKKLAGNPDGARAEFKKALLFLDKFKKHHKRRQAFGKDTPLYGEYLQLKAQVHAGLYIFNVENGVKVATGVKVAARYLDEYWKLVDEGKATEMRWESRQAAKETVRIFIGGLEHTAKLLEASRITSCISGGEILDSAKGIGWKKDLAVFLAEGLQKYVGRLPLDEQTQSLRNAQVQLEAIIGSLAGLGVNLQRMIDNLKRRSIVACRKLEEWTGKDFTAELGELKKFVDGALGGLQG